MINITDGSNLHRDIIKKLAYKYTEANFNLYLKNKNTNLNFEFNEDSKEELKQLNDYYISAYNYLISLYDSNYEPKVIF